MLNDNVAILFGVPEIGGFRVDWIASSEMGASGPVFEKFKGDNRTINGESVDSAEGNSSGSMAFILSWGNSFAGKFNLEAAAGFATPSSLTVTGGQVGADIYKFTQTENMKIYAKLGGGFNLPASSSVSADYSLVVMPGEKSEQTKGSVVTSKTAEANYQHEINVAYSKSFNWDDKIAMRLKPNIKFNILAEQDVSETESGNVDNGKRTTFTMKPEVAVGIHYNVNDRLSLYTGTTVTLFDLETTSAEKGADGTAYGDGISSSDDIQGAEAGLDIGTSFKLSSTLTLDFNARNLIKSIFVSQSPIVDLFLTFKK
jgi:hypothetical protein